MPVLPSLGSEWDPAFMSEIALQGLLDRTKADEQDEEAMDMTVINGPRMSKYDIRALRVGLKVTPEMRNDLTDLTKTSWASTACFQFKTEHRGFWNNSRITRIPLSC